MNFDYIIDTLRYGTRENANIRQTSRYPLT